MLDQTWWRGLFSRWRNHAPWVPIRYGIFTFLLQLRLGIRGAKRNVRVLHLNEVSESEYWKLHFTPFSQISAQRYEWNFFILRCFQSFLKSISIVFTLHFPFVFSAHKLLAGNENLYAFLVVRSSIHTYVKTL